MSATNQETMDSSCLSVVKPCIFMTYDFDNFSLLIRNAGTPHASFRLHNLELLSKLR